MSITIVKDQILKFLQRPDAEVMAIVGAWGTGKTHTWTTVFEANESITSNETYSYVSLFGATNIDAVKFSIVANSRPIKRHTDVEPNWIQRKLSKRDSPNTELLEMTKSFPLFKDLMPSFENAAFLTVKEKLICIDDLERRSEKLDVREILGLISLLKEQKKCKVILLLNDKESDLENYKKYREKIIDVELAFDPTSEECCEIAFPEQCEYSKLLTQYATLLDIKNIRVLKKIKRLASQIVPLLKAFDEGVTDNVLHSLTLFTWCFYCSNDAEPDGIPNATPTIQYLTRGMTDRARSATSNQKSAHEIAWDQTLKLYQFTVVDDLDRELIRSVMSGFFNELVVTELASFTHQSMVAHRANADLRNAWQLYHQSLEDNSREIIDAFDKNIKTYPKLVSINDLNDIVKLVRELGEDGRANELIDHYISSHQDDPAQFDIANARSRFVRQVDDPILLEKFSAAFVKFFGKESVESVIKKIASTNQWTEQNELKRLREATDEQFYATFKELPGKDINDGINCSLAIADHDLAMTGAASTSKNLRKALRRIANENLINRIRMQRFKI